MRKNILRTWTNDFAKKRRLNSRCYSYVSRITKKYLKKSKGTWLDLGCGDGRVLIYLATQFPSIHFCGVDKESIMIRNLGKAIRLQNIRNISRKKESGENYLRSVRDNKKFEVISLFQSIHFFDYNSILDSICKRLKENGLIIIGSTTHCQFKSIPYSKNALICRIEKKRTPDWSAIVSKLKKRRVRLKQAKTFSIVERFKNCEELHKYLNQIPYSAFGLVNSKLREKVIDEIMKKYHNKRNFNFVIDKFKIGVFIHTRKIRKRT